MPLRDHMKIISVDDYLIERPRVWPDRLPQSLRKRGPRIVADDEGHQMWRHEGNLHPQIGLNAWERHRWYQHIGKQTRPSGLHRK